LSEINLYQYGHIPQVFIHSLCDCGKKYLDFKDAEALSKEEAELYFVQAASNRRKQAV